MGASYEKHKQLKKEHEILKAAESHNAKSAESHNPKAAESHDPKGEKAAESNNGTSCAKPKFHYMLHTPDVFERTKANLSCFPLERKHVLVKRSGEWVFRNYERTLVAHI